MAGPDVGQNGRATRPEADARQTEWWPECSPQCLRDNPVGVVDAKVDLPPVMGPHLVKELSVWPLGSVRFPSDLSDDDKFQDLIVPYHA